MSKLDQLIEELAIIESNEVMDYLEKMKLKFKIQDLIAAEELKQLLEQ
jgi:hypothetical protein